MSPSGFAVRAPASPRTLDAELPLGIPAEVLVDEGRRKTIEAGGHRRVSREEIPRSSDGQSGFEGLPGLPHETAGALQDGEGRVPFIQMTDFRLNAERVQQAPSADPEQQLLREAQLRTAAIELAGDRSMSRIVRGVIAVEQVERRSPDARPATRAATPSNQARRSPGATIRRWPGVTV